MSKDTTRTFQLQRIADHLEKQAGISPGRSEFDMTEEARLTRIADALEELSLVGGLDSGTLDDLLDVALTSEQIGQVLEFDGSFWRNVFLELSDLDNRAHDLLTGLLQDDHTQYLLANGVRELSSNWEMGNFAVVNGDVRISSGARIRANQGSNDDLYLSALGTGNIRLNSDSGSGGIEFFDGSAGSVGSIDSSGNLQVNGDITVDGEMQGSRCVFLAGQKANFSADTYLQGPGGGSVMLATRGWKMHRPGSIVGIGWTLNVVAVTTGGTFAVRVRKNGSNVFANQITLSSPGDIGATGAQARGNDTFVAGDILTLFADFNTFVGSVGNIFAYFEVVFDT